MLELTPSLRLQRTKSEVMKTNFLALLPTLKTKKLGEKLNY